MALKTRPDLADWESIFIEACISVASTKTYTLKIYRKKIMKDCLHILDRAMFKELVIRTMGDMLATLKLEREPLVSLPLQASYANSFISRLQFSILPLRQRTKDSVYWPGMKASIQKFKANGSIYANIVTSQSQEQIIIILSLELPFQQIVIDLFSARYVAYFICEIGYITWLYMVQNKPTNESMYSLVSLFCTI